MGIDTKNPMVNPSGQSFSSMREEGKYYVNKTMLVADILRNDRGKYLYIRPRRFGKSTNISMLDAFFNIEYRGNTWFRGLAVSEREDLLRYKNAFPVVYLNLKDVVGVDGFDAFRSALVSVLRVVKGMHSDVVGTATGDDANTIGNLSGQPCDEDIKEFVPALCRTLRAYHGSRVVILIDEYDHPISKTFGREPHVRIMEFMNDFYSRFLKDDDDVQLAYVTGLFQLAKAGTHSGLNNLEVNSIFSLTSDERFGFTEDEVEVLLGVFHKEDRLRDVRRWYDGYRFGKAEVYNPFSIASYLAGDGRMQNYWVNSSDDNAIRWLLEVVDIETLATVMDIVNGRKIECSVDTSIVYGDFEHADLGTLITLLSMAGYLKAVPKRNGRYTVSVPNKEVLDSISKLMDRMVSIEPGLFRDFNKAVLAGNADDMAEGIQRILRNGSYYELRDETSYELILLTLMHGMLRHYSVKAQQETGNGRVDILLTPRRKGLRPMIFELKKVSAEAELESASEEAISQIHSRKYYLGMNGDVLLVGMAFCGKIANVRTEAVRQG